MNMSPGLAIHDPIFCRYVEILGGMLAGGGLLLAIFTWVLRRNVKKVWVTYLSWWVMGPLLLGAVCLGRPWVIVLLGLFSFLGFKEFARATGLYQDWWMTGVGYVGVVAATLTALV